MIDRQNKVGEVLHKKLNKLEIQFGNEKDKGKRYFQMNQNQKILTMYKLCFGKGSIHNKNYVLWAFANIGMHLAALHLVYDINNVP